MSDFLNNLVARTMSPASVVQPRLGSVFEPVSLPGVGVSSALFMDQSTSEASLPRQLPPTAEIRLGGIEHREFNGDSPAKDYGARVVDRLVSPRPSPLEGNRHDVKSSLGPQAPSVDSSGAANEQGLPLPLFRPLIDPKVTDTDPGHSIHTEPVLTPVTVRPLVLSSVAAPHRQDSMVIVPVHNLHADAPAAEGAKTINVTIGRVDVRAVFPPAPPAKVNFTKPHPPMSLDEYLKQRNEGRR